MDIYTIWVAVRRRMATFCLRLRGVKIGKGSVVGLRVDIPFNPSQVEIGARCFISDGCTFYCNNHNGKKARIVIGDDVVINKSVVIDCAELVEIGAGSRIGVGVFITDHQYDFHSKKTLTESTIVTAEISIGKNVYIGANSTLLGRVFIPENTVIAAGSRLDI
ncbi:MAG: acyltransferase [Bacteroidetes bacterium]|nr:acyltransferase [Bacteroidota bacterium]